MLTSGSRTQPNHMLLEAEPSTCPPCCIKSHTAPPLCPLLTHTDTWTLSHSHAHHPSRQPPSPSVPLVKPSHNLTCYPNYPFHLHSVLSPLPASRSKGFFLKQIFTPTPSIYYLHPSLGRILSSLLSLFSLLTASFSSSAALRPQRTPPFPSFSMVQFICLLSWVENATHTLSIPQRNGQTLRNSFK